MAEFVTAESLTIHSGLSHGFFTRRGGVSVGPYASLNCSVSGKDDPAAVRENRRRVAAALGLPGTVPAGLTQVHGTEVAVLDTQWADTDRPSADALVTKRPGVVLGVLTADCAPVLFADPGAGVIGAAHAGWRGAVAGVLEATIDAMVALGARREAILAAVGPCIRQPSYEVAADLRDAVLARDAADARFFADGVQPDRWQFDLAGYCAARLAAAGTAVEVTPHDTLALDDSFFSHRRRTLAGGGLIGHQLSAIAIGG
ncbi:peptidoglycan editing factor PgeF [Roseomonas terrae]|jgi:YfiH family protein|uniref:Purine nucleoside phosphorylase n=1 Tax=Neoroseomonas terrae TaxID=424799 RepID=A0ABS5EMC9_9PROT|nr:peptidoglycan editing factor PgeF [Neoroseomonas terrae]MBR0652185.1 peptidoglycan editing factor PgeF [Neoroseomonas terrae]